MEQLKGFAKDNKRYDEFMMMMGFLRSSYYNCVYILRGEDKCRLIPTLVSVYLDQQYITNLL